MIMLKPVGGLCNRLRAISTMISLCEDIQQDLRICWINNDELNSEFHDLFLPIHSKTIKVEFLLEKRDQLLYSDRQMNFLRQKTYNSLLKIYQRFYFDKVLHVQDTLNLIENNKGFHFLKNFKRSYVASWSKFKDEIVAPSLFKPIPEIQAIIDDQIKELNSQSVGIHIRRADHAIAIKKSPVELFSNKMSELISTNPDTNFYLASDSIDVKRQLKKQYGSKVIIQNQKNSDRKSTSGMIEAVVDLFSLAATTFIYGSYASSFATTAAEIGEIPYEELKN